jgi:Na+-driven multidrug efflux pump
MVMGIYVTIVNWNNIYAYFINGVGKIRLQLYIGVGASVIYIPLAIGLSRKLGITGIIVSMCIVLLPSSILCAVQYHKIINRTASGIWKK